MITESQYEKAIEDEKAAREIINAYGKQERYAFSQRLIDNPIFTDDELIYAAFNLCPCGHGIAYPVNCGPGHYWDCSAILKNIASDDVKHTDKLPFVCYEIKSEKQPSARGATTRGVFKPENK
jgi:hypothetical protein